jgi:predicted nuclease of predicted toxin-antitoxin system
MRFLLDQDVYALTARFLAAQGHDVLTASQAGFAQASDSTLLQMAREQGRVLVTRDRDFGEIVFVKEIGRGVIYLRVRPSTVEAVHRELARLLQERSEDELWNAFVVVEPGRHRFRRLS